MTVLHRNANGGTCNPPLVVQTIIFSETRPSKGGEVAFVREKPPQSPKGDLSAHRHWLGRLCFCFAIIIRQYFGKLSMIDNANEVQEVMLMEIRVTHPGSFK